MSMSDVHEEELSQLKKLLDERRASSVRGAYPVNLRDTIVRLWRNGVPVKVLSERLGIATSMLYAWGKKERADASATEAVGAQVLQVQGAPSTPDLASNGELRLQLGVFAVTVHVAGA
jgi:hypothetical protein